MINKKSLLLILFFISINFQTGYCQNNFIHRQGKTIVDSSGQAVSLRGVNLGGWLLWEAWIYGGGFMGETEMINRLSRITGNANAQQFRQQVYENYITEEDIAAISQSCYNVVRIAFNHRLLEDDTLPYVYKQSGWNILDSTLSWCEKHNVYVVLDMHGAPGGQNNLFISDPDSSGKQLWDKEDNKLRTIALWKAIAARYKDRTIVAGYDLLNEPASLWWDFSNYFLVDLYTRIIGEIRKVDTNHMMIIEGASSASDFSMFMPPNKDTLLDNNLCFSFHIYTWFGEDPAAGTAKYKKLSDTANAPFWCGEWGENNYLLLDSTKDALNDVSNELSGWSFWTWKKVPPTNGNPYLSGIAATALWTKLINYINDSVGKPKPTYNEAIQAMNDFIEAVKYANTIKGTVLNTLLSPCTITSVTNKSISNSDFITLFPNPAQDILNVITNNEFPIIHYSVYDIIGSMISEGVFSGNSFQIDVRNYPDGIYFLKLSDGKTTVNKKFLVVKN